MSIPTAAESQRGNSNRSNTKENHVMNKRIASVGIVAGLAIGGGAGLVLSQVSGATATTARQTAVAPTDDSTPTTAAGSTTAPSPTPAADTNRPQPGAAEKTALDKLVTDGTITQAQEDAVIKSLDAARPVGGPGGGPDCGRHGGFGGGMQFDVAAKAIGVTTADLRTAVQGGKTIAAVATSKGVTPQAVIDALVADVKTREAAEVTAGTQTQAQADTKIADATTHITTFVNSTTTMAGDDHGPGMGGPGMGGMGGRHGEGGAPAGAPTSTPAGTATSQAAVTTTA